LKLIQLNLQPPEKKEQTFRPIQSGSWGSMSAFLPRTKFDYAKEVGDGLGSSVLMSPIKWVQRTFPDAPLEMRRITSGEPEAVTEHELLDRVLEPNPFYDDAALWAGTLYSYILDGNGYWLKIRKTTRGLPWWQDVTGQVQQLWYVPHWMIEPKSENGAFISHYDYRVGGQLYEVAPENVIHFRNGIDPRNPRKGMSLVYSELREIFTDDEAANFGATLLKNMGVPGIVVSPDAQGTVAIENPAEIKAIFRAAISGERRGDPVVMTAPTRVDQFKIDQAGMNFGELRNTPEERLCAAIGIPPEVVGFGTGIQNTKVGATMTEKKRMAWENCLIPMQTAFAKTLRSQLLPEFESKPQRLLVAFNYKNVQALADNQKEKSERITGLVKNGILRVDHAQAQLGLEVDPTQAVYLRPIGSVAVPAETEPAPAPGPPPSKQGGRPSATRERVLARSHKETKDAATTPEERFQSTLDDLEAQTASVVASQFQSERQAVLDALKS